MVKVSDLISYKDKKAISDIIQIPITGLNLWGLINILKEMLYLEVEEWVELNEDFSKSNLRIDNLGRIVIEITDVFNRTILGDTSLVNSLLSRPNNVDDTYENIFFEGLNSLFKSDVLKNIDINLMVTSTDLIFITSTLNKAKYYLCNIEEESMDLFETTVIDLSNTFNNTFSSYFNI